VHAGNQRDRQQFHEFQELDAAQTALLAGSVAGSLLDTLVEHVEIGAGREMPQPAAKHDRAGTGLLRLLDCLDQRIDQDRAQKVVGPVAHGQHGYVTALLAPYQLVLAHVVLRSSRQ
jgi:hypothetical protein